uniref:NAC domain-containing protein 82-like n=1 Tax=Erigeron canadensis TaxID=72917 RepID=UPI001CB93793|nr:NAC domain-containing protein 82-like [Erigeron canadensis]XP_043621117.1 NAC domain-containing protein 82-like [Erigeron canadensis]
MRRCPGFRFHPTDVELVMFHLKRKLMGKKLVPEVIAEVNIYDFSPWDLPDKSNLRDGDLEWFFFCPKSKKYLSGSRTNRSTEAGYWKATGKDREVKYKGRIVAMIKTLIFHLGHPPKGTRTDWVMHEFRMEDKDLANAGVAQEAYVLCRLFEKSGAGPQNGAQYGAPFKEEEWDDDTEDVSLSGTITETVNPTGSCSTLCEINCTVPEPSISPSFESERHLKKSTVTSSAHLGLLGVREMVILNAGSSSVMNLNLTEPGPCTITSLGNESYYGPTNDDALLTSEDIALLLHNDTQEVENCKGKKIMTDARNEDDVIVLDPAAYSTLDDLSLDGFDMFNVDGSANDPMDAFTLDDLEEDLNKFF